jgi:hypothetical protein
MARRREQFRWARVEKADIENREREEFEARKVRAGMRSAKGSGAQGRAGWAREDRVAEDVTGYILHALSAPPDQAPEGAKVSNPSRAT